MNSHAHKRDIAKLSFSEFSSNKLPLYIPIDFNRWINLFSFEIKKGAIVMMHFGSIFFIAVGCSVVCAVLLSTHKW